MSQILHIRQAGKKEEDTAVKKILPCVAVHARNWQLDQEG
jgi:hypothetical protein